MLNIGDVSPEISLQVSYLSRQKVDRLPVGLGLVSSDDCLFFAAVYFDVCKTAGSDLAACRQLTTFRRLKSFSRMPKEILLRTECVLF